VKISPPAAQNRMTMALSSGQQERRRPRAVPPQAQVRVIKAPASALSDAPRRRSSSGEA
jgi:hypothetical protein